MKTGDLTEERDTGNTCSTGAKELKERGGGTPATGQTGRVNTSHKASIGASPTPTDPILRPPPNQAAYPARRSGSGARTETKREEEGEYKDEKEGVGLGRSLTSSCSFLRAVADSWQPRDKTV